ncbi:hypothetical protein HBN65_03675 [Pseudomonas lundensis]|uniref:hypothetical protein n=1 Tax=Pseudomonas lundensis TaxID=86185 RepID=UPI00147382B6|nr:hypothetical protein [Pseudomonas lundensis]
MNEELERTLLSKFPEIFEITEAVPDDFLWGIHCGDGWVPLISAMCQQLQLHVETTGRPQIVAKQIKHKMGILRCVFAGTDDYSNGVINTVIGMSFVTCEMCGNKGVLARGSKGWIRVLCDQCRLANPG